MVTIDYYSNYLDTDKIANTTAKSLVSVCKRLFIPHSFPTRQIVAYNSIELHEFAKNWDFGMLTSSPKYIQK